MKNITVIIIALVTVLTFSACSTNSPNNGNNSKGNTNNAGQKSNYKDGTYESTHKNEKFGYEQAVVTIKNGKIEKIDLKRLGNDQKEVNYADWDGTKNNYPNLKQYRLDLANAMVNKQSPDVDVISSATQSSNGWKAAVTDALSKAQ